MSTSDNTHNDPQYTKWVDSFKSKLGEVDSKVGKLSIFRVPSKLRKLNEDAYKPSVVSIGPFHRNKEELQLMEGFKWRYTLLFLKRAGDAEAAATFGKCAEAINAVEKEIRGYYMDDIELTPHQLNEILIVDGCFILELLIRYSEGVNQVYADPIISNDWVVQGLRHDLVVLDNQIPFIILLKLFNIIAQSRGEGTELLSHSSVTAYALLFFQPALGRSVHGELGRICCDQYAGKHLLDILHKLYQPVSHQTNPRDQQTIQNIKSWGFRVGAAELLKAGIRIEVDRQPNSNLLDINFNKKEGVLTIPTLQTGELTESILRNLIAYEQCRVGKSNHVTSYARLIGSLIRNRQDIDSLEKKGVIVKPTNSTDNENVTNLFRSMCKEVVYKDFCYAAMCDEVNEYRRHWLNWSRIKASLKVRWHGCILTLRNEYFTNLWTTLSVIAAAMLLILTVLQTIYTVRGYYRHGSTDH